MTIHITKKQITKEQFMDFFRSDKYSELTSNDCLEIFLDSLKGKTDLTYELLDELCCNYGVNLEKIIY